MIECSVIIPFCNEGPNIVFTIQSIIEELDGFCKYEIIIVDNMSDEWIQCTAGYYECGNRKKPFIKGDRTWPIRSRIYFSNPYKGRTINTMFFRKGIVKYYQYDQKLGHWNAKNFGISKSSGKYLFFLDGHCIMKRDSLKKMITWMNNTKEPIGGLHAYICYMLDSRRLEYFPQKKTFGYRFCSAQPNKTEPYKVCVMSTCGMMCPRTVIEKLGAWHPEFGIYCGGESYINWKQSTCGYAHWIHPEAVCWHYAENRGYSWNYDDKVRNEFIAAYTVGGNKFLEEQSVQRKAKPGSRVKAIELIANDVIIKCKDDRDFIKKNQVITFDEYIDWWEKNPGKWK